MHTANIWKISEHGFLSEIRNKMWPRWRRADSAKTISLHHHIVGGDLIIDQLNTSYVEFEANNVFVKC